MASLADYFARQAYQHTYDMGDRVQGTYEGIPFFGTVGNDRLINHERGPEVTVHLDLPMQVDDVTRYIVVVKHADIKAVK